MRYHEVFLWLALIFYFVLLGYAQKDNDDGWTWRGSFNSQPSRSTLPSPRAKVVAIVQQKCKEYAEARYKLVKKGGKLPGQVSVLKKELDCPTTDTLIVGGTVAKRNEFPHMALVGYGNYIDNIHWICSGSLISDRFILSAAHCSNIKTPREVKWAALGLSDKRQITPDKKNRNLYRITQAFNHPLYHARHTNHDIALYKLEISVTFKPSLRPICLQTSKDIPDEMKNKAGITGWGQTGAGEAESEVLLKARIFVLKGTLCAEYYDREPRLRTGFDEKSMVCAGHPYLNMDTCQGDSGGPIHIPSTEKCLLKQVGITSIGSNFCGDYTPTIYTRVSYYLDWIQSVVWP